MTSNSNSSSVTALRVEQWLDEWDSVRFDADENQARPKGHFYVFSMPAVQLRTLSGTYRRSTDDAMPRKEDLRIQRKHDPERSEEINRYVHGGFPWSALSKTKRANPDTAALRKPGWLPTAVVVNILEPGDERAGREIGDSEVIRISENPAAGTAQLTLPETPGGVPPIEVIDGQHRLYAFENDVDLANYQLPVVAFHGLDISWQAYLFWTINIKPKKINPSLAFDLYPLLREQDWLDGGETIEVYKESRAQELTEMLWSAPQSPWYRRINMLGGSRRENGPVTQAAFVRSLTASMVKSWRPRNGMGGIFGGTTGAREGLSWSRLQQGAFLVSAWQLLAQSVITTQAPWARSLRATSGELDQELFEGRAALDPAFAGSNSLLATDQGVRGFQYLVNDLAYVRHQELDLASWRDDSDFPEGITPELLSLAQSELESQPVYDFLRDVADILATFDWRSSSAPDLDDTERRLKASLRGSGGYRELRTQLLKHVAESGDTPIARSAALLVEE